MKEQLPLGICTWVSSLRLPRPTVVGLSTVARLFISPSAVISGGRMYACQGSIARLYFLVSLYQGHVSPAWPC